MHRDTQNKMIAGVLSGIGASTGIGAGLCRVIFLIGFFGVGVITFGISSAALLAIYILCWMLLPAK
jgi:phage shock protein PspC (stress-responsive transcriptional regulator)